MNSMSLFKTEPLLLTIISILVASNIYTLIPIYEVIAGGLDIAASDVVIAGSLFTLFYAGGLLSFGPISDYLGRKNILVFGLLASSLIGTFGGKKRGKSHSLYSFILLIGASLAPSVHPYLTFFKS